MRPNDETIYTGMVTENEVNPQVANENKKGDSWKMIGLGGATGILIGAGAIYASSAMAAESNDTTPEQPSSEPASTDPVSAAVSSETEINVAHTTPGKSFSEAFAEARAEVGPGGVFHWRGGVYGTYTKEEWDAMSDQEKHEFVESARPEFSVAQVNTNQITEEHPRAHVVAQHHEEPDPEVNININEVHIHTQNEGGDEDVHVVTHVGTDVDAIGDDIAVIDQYVVDGHNAYVVDYLDDDLHDVAVVDVNDNDEIDDGEIIDLTTEEILNTDGTLYNASVDATEDTGVAPETFDA